MVSTQQHVRMLGLAVTLFLLVVIGTPDGWTDEVNLGTATAYGLPGLNSLTGPRLGRPGVAETVDASGNTIVHVAYWLSIDNDSRDGFYQEDFVLCYAQWNIATRQWLNSSIIEISPRFNTGPTSPQPAGSYSMAALDFTSDGRPVVGYGLSWWRAMTLRGMEFGIVTQNASGQWTRSESECHRDLYVSQNITITQMEGSPWVDLRVTQNTTGSDIVHFGYGWGDNLDMVFNANLNVYYHQSAYSALNDWTNSARAELLETSAMSASSVNGLGLCVGQSRVCLAVGYSLITMGTTTYRTKAFCFEGTGNPNEQSNWNLAFYDQTGTGIKGADIEMDATGNLVLVTTRPRTSPLSATMEIYRRDSGGTLWSAAELVDDEASNAYGTGQIGNMFLSGQDNDVTVTFGTIPSTDASGFMEQSYYANGDWGDRSTVANLRWGLWLPQIVGGVIVGSWDNGTSCGVLYP